MPAVTVHAELVKLSIDAGADINETYKKGNTPLWSAAANAVVQVVWVSTEAGAEQLVKSTKCNISRPVGE